MNWGIFVILAGVAASTLAQVEDSSVDSARPYPTPKCGPNEVSTNCYNDCQKTCKNRIIGSDRVCTLECGRTGCLCKPDYLRHDNGTCVPVDQCSPPDCSKGEVYSECGSSCPPSCENKGNTCLACTLQCVPGCYCAGKTIRAQDGTCVLPEKCPAPKCTGPNEEFDECPPTCPRTQNCSNIWSKIPCTPIDCCKPQCRCKSGFFRNDQNICVSGRECSNPNPECGPNEVSTDCYNDCQKTCKNRIIGSDKVCTLECGRTGCLCKPDYLRHDNGTCVPVDQCSPPDCPKGKVYSECGSSCPPSCKNKGNTCLACTLQCVPGCYCAGKTIEAEGGTCVLPENCPAPRCTGPNEIFDKCPPTCPRTEKCSNLWSKEPCTEVDCCEPQCRCKPGFYRNDNNVCISAQECTNTHECSDPNAERVKCAPAAQCRATCANRNPGPCIKICVVDDCVCKKGFILSEKNGTCIPEDQCPALPDCPKGEVYSECGSSCPPSCENKGNTCLVCTAQCVPGCYCAGKTIRAQDGTCVLPEKCPAPKCTGPNEIFDKCPPTCPRTQNCSNLWSKIPCTPIDCCKPQCRCRPGFYRNGKNICISGKQCTNPPPQCGPNEVSTDCYNDCQKTCKNRIIGSDRVCTLECGRTGCLCKPDYLRHDNGTCVPVDQCSPPDCPKGEVYNECGSSCPPSCENKGNTCLVCTKECVPGCYCSGKTIRAQNGSCVLPENCPAPKCTGPNEIFDKCPPTCPRTDNCSNIWSKIPCTPIDCCKPQCRCKSGFFRNDQNICVSGRECSGGKPYGGSTDEE